jgi:hypothetical protein
MIKKVGGVAGHLRFGNNEDGGASVCVAVPIMPCHPRREPAPLSALVELTFAV